MTEAEPWTNLNDPEYLNFMRLGWHCTKKGIEAGSVIGLALVTPYTLFKGRGSLSLNKLVMRQTYSVLFGVTVALGMMMGKYYGW